MKDFLNMMTSLLEGVLYGRLSYTELQNFVDTAVIEDQLPNELSEEMLGQIFDLQTDLELIAEHQSVNAGTRAMLNQEDIIKKLSKYKGVAH